MLRQLPLLLTDAYKLSHIKMADPAQTLTYSALVPRKSRLEGIDEVTVFGFQYFIRKYLIDEFNENFFRKDKKVVIEDMRQFCKDYFLQDDYDVSEFEKLHDLGYLPLKIKALEEGTTCPIGTPILTVVNTHKDFSWLPNYIEVALQASVWHMITVATKTRELRKLLERWADQTSDNPAFVDFQAHTFSMRGCSGLESSTMVDAAHLLFFKGSDTMPGNIFHRYYYDADPQAELISTSVKASEHSLATARGKGGEFNFFERIITDRSNDGIVSVVSDSYDLTEVINPDGGFLARLKDAILSREGKIVIRPDSSRKTPLEIICGDPDPDPAYNERQRPIIQRGLVRCLDEIFGSTVNSKGYKELNEKIGFIYGECITQPLLNDICANLAEQGYASTNGVYGIGSWEHIGNMTRDTFGLAQKALYAEYEEDGQIDKVNIFKDPVTDSGEKTSHQGLVRVNDDYTVDERCSWDQEGQGLLKTVFENGVIVRRTSLSQIRERALDSVKQG